MRVNGTRPNATGRASGKVYGRLGRLQRPPEGEPWCWLTRELIASPAWQARSINARRFTDFLLIEHMNHAGTENGQLLATYRQLEAFGVSVNHITKAIEECEALGLVRCQRGGRRILTAYTLTWLATSDGNAATNDWKAYKPQKAGHPKTEICPLKSDDLPPKQRAEPADLPPKQRADPTPQTEGPSISWKGEEGAAASTSAARPIPSAPSDLHRAVASAFGLSEEGARRALASAKPADVQALALQLTGGGIPGEVLAATFPKLLLITQQSSSEEPVQNLGAAAQSEKGKAA